MKSEYHTILRQLLDIQIVYQNNQWNDFLDYCREQERCNHE